MYLLLAKESFRYTSCAFYRVEYPSSSMIFLGILGECVYKEKSSHEYTTRVFESKAKLTHPTPLNLIILALD